MRHGGRVWRALAGVIRRLVSYALIFESFLAVAYLSQLISALPGHDAPVVVLVVIRGLVGALQFAAGWMLLSGRPPGVPLARMAFVTSAVLTTLEVGFNLAPTRVYPWWRWQFTAAYWVYALLALLVLRRNRLD
jgi:hypothetical protein